MFKPITYTLLVLMLFTLTGCLRLSGQRISVYHDSKADQLRMLIFYDGIHDDQDNAPQSIRTSKKKIKDFVNDGDIMFLDWFSHLSWKNFENRLGNDQNINAADAELIEHVVKKMTRRPLGHYLDQAGQISAAQHVVIEDTEKFIGLVNAAINANVPQDRPLLKEFAPRTGKLIQEAAKKNHRWVSLNGHAIKLQFPVHTGEWRVLASKGLETVIKEAAGEEANNLQLRQIIQTLFAAPLAFEQADGMVKVTLGEEKVPMTLRFRLYDSYQNNLVTAVKEAVPDGLGVEIIRASRELESGKKPSQAMADILEWGPPELGVMMHLRRVESEGEAEAKVAGKWLADFAKHWNATTALPAAPDDNPTKPVNVNNWQPWLKQMRYYPADPQNLKEKDDAIPAAEEAAPQPAPPAGEAD